MPVHLTRIGWAGLFALCVACSGAASTDTDTSTTDTGPCDIEAPAGGAWADLGTGPDFYEPLDEGDEVFVVFGPQGGYHIDGSVRVAGVNPGDADNLADPDNPETRFRVQLANGDVVSGTDYPDDDGTIRYRQGLDRTCLDGVHVMAGRRVFLTATDTELEGQTVTVTVTVEDVDGVEVSDSLTLTAVPSPFN